MLLCPSFDNQRQHLLAGIPVAIRPFAQLNILSNHDLMNLLNGNEDLPSDINKRVLEYTLNFIHETGRFNYVTFNPLYTSPLRSFFSIENVDLFHIGCQAHWAKLFACCFC